MPYMSKLIEMKAKRRVSKVSNSLLFPIYWKLLLQLDCFISKYGLT